MPMRRLVMDAGLHLGEQAETPTGVVERMATYHLMMASRWEIQADGFIGREVRMEYECEQ